MKSYGRSVRKNLFELLNRGELDEALAKIDRFPPRQIVNPLLSLIQSGNDKVKWGAVKATGRVVRRLADKDLESARVILRRLMWTLNDESGGIGWGSPEAMGEILAGHSVLGQEYAHILLSYAREDGNYLEHEGLQRGLLWGIGRLCEKRPELARGSAGLFLPYLKSRDEVVRGLAVRLMGLLQVKEARPQLLNLTEDDSSLVLMLETRLTKIRVKDLAEEALRAIG
ncbi:MAG: DVU0298 family protein [Deltaproteobacteria bacterium]